MIIEYSKVIVTSLWKHIALALLFNFIWFSSIANNDGLTLLTNDDDQLLPIMFLFAIENFLYASWLLWSKDQSNLWRQLIPSEIKVHGLHFVLFLVLAITTQLIPLMMYMHTQDSPNMYVTSSDFIGALFIWIVALFSYGLGIMACWWRKWTFGAVVFLFPTFWILIFSPVCTQLTGTAIILVALIAFVFLKQLGRGLLVSVLLSFAVYEIVAGLSHEVAFNLAHSDKEHAENTTQHHRWQSPFYATSDDDSGNIKSITSLSLHRFNPYPSLVDETNGSADWFNYQYQLPDFIISDTQLKQKLESGIHTIWVNHPGQQPSLQGIEDGILTLWFKEAVYISDKTGNWSKFWSAKPNMDLLGFEELPFTLQSISKQNLDFDTVDFGTVSNKTKTYALMARDSVSFYNIFKTAELIHTIQLPSPLKLAKIKELSVSGIDIYRLEVLTEDNTIRVFDAGSSASEFSKKEEKSNDKEITKSIWGQHHYIDLSISPVHTYIQLSGLPRFSASERYAFIKSFFWSSLLAALICLIWNRRENKKVLICKTLAVAIFAWPMLLVVVFCLPRTKHKYVASNPNMKNA